MRVPVIILLSCVGAFAQGDEQGLAKQHYQLQCMGCHGEDGAGLEGHVPSLRGTLSKISSVPQGRDYVLRVPGVTQSTLSSAEIAEVLNWAIKAFSDAESAQGIRPFTAEEVEASRSQPLLEISAARAKVMNAAE